MNHKCPECDGDCTCFGVADGEWCSHCGSDFYDGFHAGFEGRFPESPDENYLEGFCDGVIECEDCIDDGGQPWDDEEHPDSEYEPESRGH